MKKSVKTLIIILSILSILSGVYQLSKGAEFIDYFSGIFIGVVLLGSVLIHKDPPTSPDNN